MKMMDSGEFWGSWSFVASIDIPATFLRISTPWERSNSPTGFRLVFVVWAAAFPLQVRQWVRSEIRSERPTTAFLPIDSAVMPLTVESR